MVTELWPHDELTRLANHYRSDKGTSFHCAHGYTRIYQRFLESARSAPLNIGEIGLVHDLTQSESAASIAVSGCPSLRMWADYLPQSQVFGMDIADFTVCSGDRISIIQGDQGNRNDLRRFALSAGAGLDVIIDDGSHASHHQQIALGVLFESLAEGGLYIIEDLHFQPAEIEMANISKTRHFLASLSERRSGLHLALEQGEYNYLLNNIQSIQFYDSISPRWPLAVSADAIAVIRKRGKHRYIADLA